jgi:hypothetical protein
MNLRNGRKVCDFLLPLPNAVTTSLHITISVVLTWMTCDWDEIVFTVVSLFVKHWCACKPGQPSHMEHSEHIHHSESFTMFFCPYSLLCSFPSMSPSSSSYWVFYKTLGQDSVSSSYGVDCVLSLTCHWQWLIMNVTIHQAFIGLMMADISMS